jgi:hypothetical protein
MPAEEYSATEKPLFFSLQRHECGRSAMMQQKRDCLLSQLQGTGTVKGTRCTGTVNIRRIYRIYISRIKLLFEILFHSSRERVCRPLESRMTKTILFRFIGAQVISILPARSLCDHDDEMFLRTIALRYAIEEMLITKRKFRNDDEIPDDPSRMPAPTNRRAFHTFHNDYPLMRICRRSQTLLHANQR